MERESVSGLDNDKRTIMINYINRCCHIPLKMKCEGCEILKDMFDIRMKSYPKV